MEKHINEIAVCQHGIKGVIRHWDEKRQKFIGHRLDNSGRYWESKDPEFTGIKFVELEKAKQYE